MKRMAWMRRLAAVAVLAMTGAANAGLINGSFDGGFSTGWIPGVDSTGACWVLPSHGGNADVLTLSADNDQDHGYSIMIMDATIQSINGNYVPEGATTIQFLAGFKIVGDVEEPYAFAAARLAYREIGNVIPTLVEIDIAANDGLLEFYEQPLDNIDITQPVHLQLAVTNQETGPLQAQAFFDNFQFVPEPVTGMLMLAVSALLVRRRR